MGLEEKVLQSSENQEWLQQTVREGWKERTGDERFSVYRSHLVKAK